MVAWRMHLIPSSVPLDLRPVVFTLACLPVYASVALRVTTSLSVMPHPLVVPFTKFAERLGRTWESQACLEAQWITRGQGRIRGGGRAHPHPLGSNFRSRPKVLTSDGLCGRCRSFFIVCPWLGEPRLFCVPLTLFRSKILRSSCCGNRE